MSRTVEVAQQTIRQYYNTYLRKRKEGSRAASSFRIEVIDSRQVSMRAALLAMEAAECASRGIGIDDQKKHILRVREDVRVNFMVDNLDHLARGGRIGRGTALLGGFFGLKPILGMADGGVSANTRSLGGRFAYRKLIESMKKEINKSTHTAKVGICHGATPQKAEKLKLMIEEALPSSQFILSDFSPVVGTHTGPGALGVAWLPVARETSSE